MASLRGHDAIGMKINACAVFCSGSETRDKYSNPPQNCESERYRIERKNFQRGSRMESGDAMGNANRRGDLVVHRIPAL